MKRLAIIGATGLVGQTVLEVLQEENMLGEFELTMFVSDKSAGSFMQYNNKQYPLIKLSDEILKTGFDYAIFLTGEEISRIWAPKFAQVGIVVIDNSSAFRMDKNIPLIVPEINFNSIKNQDKIIANPNCSTIQLVVVLDRLIKLAKIKKIVVSSYQSVSGAGKDALMDLWNQTENFFTCGIKDNIIPQIGGVQEDGNCTEENKIILETKKILDVDFDIFATTVRVPTSYCHGESVFIEFEEVVNIEKIRKELDVENIKLGDMFYLTDCAGTNETYVCRLRQSSENCIQMFIIADNLRRGAGFNAVKILKNILKRDDERIIL